MTALNLSDKLELVDSDRVRCVECQRWEWSANLEKGQQIKHSSRCSSQEQPKRPAQAPVKKSGKFNPNGKSTDELLDALYMQEITMSEAMNTDY